MSELAKRAMTGAAYVALTLGAAWAGPVTTTLLFLPVCLLAASEMQRLTGNGARDPASPIFPILAAGLTYLAVACSAFIIPLTARVAAGVVFLIFFIGVLESLLRNSTTPAKDIGGLLLVILYIALPFGLIPSLLHNGPYLFVGFMVMLWTNDTGAYLVGRTMGRTPLLPRVSPKKTVEGLLGGIALTVVAGVLLSRAWPVLTMPQWVACAITVSIASTVGDLLESAFKRAADVKDSGTILPGHGGIMDRFDGFLLALPAMLFCVGLLT